jgi:hypothetical protein
MTSAGVDRELLAVLVALEPLDDRKWDYLDLRQRTFHSERMLEEPWSSGERTLIDVAASLWNTGTVDLGYIACALGGRHLQAVLDATAVRAGHELSSNMNRAVARISPGADRSSKAPRRLTEGPVIGPVKPPVHRQNHGLGR